MDLNAAMRTQGISEAAGVGSPAPSTNAVPLGAWLIRGVAWLRAYAGRPSLSWVSGAAALRHDEHRRINKKKVQRLWAEEGLQRRVHSRRKRTGRPRTRRSARMLLVVWALDFQFDSTIDGRGHQDRLDDGR